MDWYKFHLGRFQEDLGKMHNLNEYDISNLTEAYGLLIKNIGANKRSIVRDVLLYHFKYLDKPIISHAGLYFSVVSTIRKLEDTDDWNLICKKLGGNNRFKWDRKTHMCFNKNFIDVASLLKIEFSSYYGIPDHCYTIIVQFLAVSDAYYTFSSKIHLLSMPVHHFTEEEWMNKIHQMS